jgi:hypothetical protein
MMKVSTFLISKPIRQMPRLLVQIAGQTDALVRQADTY